MAQPIRRSAWVSDWQNPRTIFVDGNKVSLEVALSHDHCPTCAHRVRFVTRKLAERNIQYTWVYADGGKSFIQIEAPGAGLPVEKHFASLLGVSVESRS